MDNKMLCVYEFMISNPGNRKFSLAGVILLCTKSYLPTFYLHIKE